MTDYLRFFRTVQKSVFECPNLTEQKFARMKTSLDNAIDHTCDTFRFYPVCRNCVGKVELSGIGEPPETRNYRVI